MSAVAALQAGAIITQAWLLAMIIDRAVISGIDLGDLWPVLLVLLVVLVVRAAGETLRGWISAGASARIRSTLRPKLFARMIEAGPALTGRSGTGALSSTLIERVDALDSWYARFLPQQITVAVVAPAILIAVFIHDWLAGLFLLLAAPLIPLFMVLIGQRTEALTQQQHNALEQLSGVFYDRLRGLDVIRRFGAERREARRIGGLIEELRTRTMSVLRVAFLSTAVLEFFSAVAIAAVAIYVGMGLLGYIDFGPAHRLDLHTGLFVLLLAPEFFLPLRQLSQFWHDRAGALSAATPIRTILATPPGRNEPDAPEFTLPTGPARLHLQGVGLSWPDRGPVLENISMKIEPGQRVLVTGASGAGKSTLLHLAAGLLEPNTGSIEINGVDIARLRRSDLARIRSWMGQASGLVDGTLTDNLLLACPEADKQSLTRALQLAGLGEFVRTLPAGLDTPIGQDGEGLSGGQVRRLCLARAIIGRQTLLLLDEPTASLDPDTAASIWNTLESISSEHRLTMLCASHDLAARSWADRVYTLQLGKLMEIRP